MTERGKITRIFCSSLIGTTEERCSPIAEVVMFAWSNFPRWNIMDLKSLGKTWFFNHSVKKTWKILQASEASETTSPTCRLLCWFHSAVPSGSPCTVRKWYAGFIKRIGIGYWPCHATSTVKIESFGKSVQIRMFKISVDNCFFFSRVSCLIL